MNEHFLRIGILEPSDMLFEGLRLLIGRPGLETSIIRLNSLSDLPFVLLKNKFNLIFANPSYFFGNHKLLHDLKSEHPETRWIGIDYSGFPPSLVSLFDRVLSIFDSQDYLQEQISELTSADSPDENPVQESLSYRETEVLKLLAQGFPNKEIADKLCISIHTVITHRKNISQKTGIKSISGLTVYAVVNKIISIRDTKI
jgi:DNA-binding CsgD family transcriptional regulator